MEKDILQKFADLDETGTMELVRQAIDKGIDSEVILNTCQEAMVLVGDKFEQGVYFISDLILSGMMFKQVNELLKPLFVGKSAKEKAGKIVVGTVAGDIHDLGKDLVVAMLEANNFEVYDIGVDQPKEAFVDKIKETGATIVGLSGLLTVAFGSMKETVAALETAGLRDKVKVMIGGGPVTQNTCDFVGADRWGNSAQSAVNHCREWMNV